MSRLFYVCVLYKPYCRSLHTRFGDRNPECLCDSCDVVRSTYSVVASDNHEAESIAREMVLCDVHDLYRDDTFVSFVLSNSIPISDV